MSKAKQKAQPGTMKKVLEYLRPYMGLVALSVLLYVLTIVVRVVWFVVRRLTSHEDKH